MPDNEVVIRRPFWEMFSPAPDGGIRLDNTLVVNGVRYQPGFTVMPGQLMGGVDMAKRKGIELALVEIAPDAYVLRGFYLPDVS